MDWQDVLWRKPEFYAPRRFAVRLLRRLRYNLVQPDSPLPVAAGLCERPPLVVAQRDRARDRRLGFDDDDLLGKRSELWPDSSSDALDWACVRPADL